MNRFVIPLLALSLAFASGTARADVDEDMEAAMGAMRTRDYVKASELLTKILDNPDLTQGQALRALRGRGHAWHELRQFKLAIADYSRAIDMRPGFSELWNSRCWSRLYVRQPRAALEDCNVALKLDPAFGAALDSRAMAYSAIGEFDKSLEDHKKALERSKVAEHYYNRAITYERRGDEAAAAKDFAEARKRSSDDEHWKRIEREMAPLRQEARGTIPAPPPAPEAPAPAVPSTPTAPPTQPDTRRR